MSPDYAPLVACLRRRADKWPRAYGDDPPLPVSLRAAADAIEALMGERMTRNPQSPRTLQARADGEQTNGGT